MARRDTLRGGGERGRWLSPLVTHVLPALGKRRASALHQGDIADTLRPIWRAKHETAQKCIQRLRIVFTFGQLAGIAGVEPVTVDRAAHILGHVARKTTPIPAVDWREIPGLWAQLVENPTIAHLCLRWLLLTAVRQSAGRGARFDEIQGDIWTVPADRVKATAQRAAPFRVPLSPAALDLLEELRPLSAGGLLFPGNARKGGWVRGPITDTATQKALRLLGHDAAPHGFRTSFRTWVQDTEAGSFDVAETALGHTVGGRVERSYARSDLLDARRVLTARWADFVTGAQTGGNVVPLRGAAG
jgi:integrase